MKPDKKILCRVGSKFRDFKVVQIWQWLEASQEERIDNYIRADIVEQFIDGIESFLCPSDMILVRRKYIEIFQDLEEEK